VTLGSCSGADAVIFPPVSSVNLRRIAAQEPAVAAAQGVSAPELPVKVIGSSTEMREVWRLVMAAALGSSSVLIAGETGTGKEVVARALHRFSARRAGAFVAVNCAALPENLLESELFGHEKGAFTGASTQRKGRFELADHGTLFLDEIGDLPLSLQVKLLRVLQERTFERLGGSKSVSVDVRVVAATHRDLQEEVKRGRFRADLYYRLNVLCIRVPPLRQRSADVLEFWRHFIDQGTASESRRALQTSTAVHRLLLRHDWPGNVRELHNVAQHVLTLAPGDRILPGDLPEYLSRSAERVPQSSGFAGLTLKEIERMVIQQTYEALGTVNAAAAVLGISARKIHYRLKELNALGPKPAQPAVPVSEPGASPRSRVRVLLAEDDDDLRWALSDLLKTDGFDVVAVADGRALLEHLGTAMLLEQRDAPPDIIISDIRMPGMTGMQLLECVRNRGWSTPVVLMSAFGEKEIRKQASDLGAAAFLDKPIDPTKLQELLHSAVGS
jgi:DNA-binding NtrC family response regulator